MSQSVKLSDGSYLDSTGVYDTSLGMTQQAINNAVSHVGQIIFSTTLDTMEKVVAVYGGTTWSKIEGQFLLGASSSYANGSTGGEATHKLTANEMPKHNHKFQAEYGTTSNLNTGVPGKYNQLSAYGSGYDYTDKFMQYTGGSAAHNNMPPYRAVYIWERTA